MGVEFDARLALTGVFVARWLLSRAELSPGAKLVYALLAQKVNAGGAVRLNLCDLAGEVGVEEQQVATLLLELEERDLIGIQSHPVGANFLRCFLLYHPWMVYSGSSMAGGALASQTNANVPGTSRRMRNSERSRRPGAREGSARAESGRAGPPQSKYDYETALQYARWRIRAGEGIENEYALARYLHRTGEQDDEIALMLALEEAAAPGHEDSSNVVLYKRKG